MSELMLSSFQMCQSDILTNVRPVAKILEDYPFLKDKDENYLISIIQIMRMKCVGY